MKQTIAFTQFLLLLALVTIAPSVFAQGGGTLPSTPATKPKPVEPVEPATTKTTNTRARQSSAIDRIDGKWLTSGNDFGTSQMVLTQAGGNITGIITWSDGRTGTLTGTFAAKRLRFTFQSSTGESGSGWLELSWANFLGGPWKSPRVRNGSWTLNRIEGQWCFAGDRNRVRRVTHDEHGRLTIITESGEQQSGYQDGWLYLNSTAGPVKGVMFYKGNRIDWADGTFWTWCGRTN